MTYDPHRYWPERARKHGEVYVAGGNDPERHRDQLEKVGPIVEEFARGRLIDFGCGHQRFRPWAESGGAEYHGVDLIPGFGTEPLEYHLPGGFEAAMALWVLQHIVCDYEYVHWVRELHSCLREGGRLLVLDHQRQDLEAEHMMPRGPNRIVQAAPWTSWRGVGAYRSHWIAVFTR